MSACISFVGEGSIAIIEGHCNLLLDCKNKFKSSDSEVTAMNVLMISELEVWQVVFYN